MKSESDKCIAKRNVVLYQVKKGKKSPVGHDVTDKKGHWKVGHLSDVHGKFYASVKRAKVSAGTCESAKSKTISR
ncbi:MAG: hypothetical protein M3290_03520 [Actinomycetota bacterium]|nr:hypothetical protein [Actinomycetota bacterium]